MDATDIQVIKYNAEEFPQVFSSELYTIMLFASKGSYSLDFSTYNYSGYNILFFAPYQTFQWKQAPHSIIELLTFHSDFYCIEYHKKEVACNGLLFNNIFLYPHIPISKAEYEELMQLFTKIEEEKQQSVPFTDSIIKTYLQLILAISSRLKNQRVEAKSEELIQTPEMNKIEELINAHFITERSPAFYSDLLMLSPSSFSKKCKAYFGKTPTQLIQDRVILEAKKLLHLTTLSIKEIAYKLNFDDEFYFSRYFKKAVDISPLFYREKVGIASLARE